MATEVKRRRGTTAQHSSFTGAEGEITVDLTKDTLVVHDGSTQAGFPLLREDFSNIPSSVSFTSDLTMTGVLTIDRSSASSGFALNILGSSQDNIRFLHDGRTIESTGVLNIDAGDADDENLNLNASHIYINNNADVDGNLNITGEATASEFIGDLRGAVRFQVQADVAIAKGDAVYISGVSGNKPTVGLADANDASKMPAFGLAAGAINANASGEVITFGTLSTIDTSSFTVGDVLYISDTGTSGNTLTATAPAGESSQIQNIGKVQRSHASAGSIKVGGAGRSNATPNLDQNKIFLGDSNNRSVSTALSNIGLSSFNNDAGFVTSTGDNTFVTSASFNTGDGVLTLTRNDSNTVTADLDGRFLQLTGGTVTGMTIFEDGMRVGTGNHFTDGRASITFGEGATTTDSMYIEYDGENLSGDSNGIFIGSAKTGVGDIVKVEYGGNVGIGTTSPLANLHIEGANNNDTNDYAQLYIKGTGAYPLDIAGIVLDSAGSNQSHLRFSNNGSPKFQIRYNNGDTADDKLKFYSWTQTADIVTFDGGTGNVGIGTTSPSSSFRLDVNGAGRFVNDLYADEDLVVADNIYLSDTNTKLTEGSGDALRMQTTTGYVDIGSQNSSYLHLQTDRDRFYFNKQLVINTGIIESYDEDLQLRRAASSSDKLTIKDNEFEFNLAGATQAKIEPNGKFTLITSTTTKPSINSGASGTEVLTIESGNLNINSSHVYIDNGANVDGDLVVASSITSGSFVKDGGTSSQFLKADGSVDSSAYLTSFDITTQTDPKYLRSNASDTTTGNITISKTDPTLSLYDSNGASGSYPRINFNTANNQGVSLYHTEYDGELPVNGYGLILDASSSNTQFPSTGTLSFSVLGEMFTGGTTLASLNKVFHDGYHPNADTLTTARTITLGGDLTGSASFDGSADITISAQVSNNSHTHDDRYLRSNADDTTTGNITIGKADPVLILNDTSASNSTVLTAFTSYRAQGSEKGFVGYGSGSNNYLYVRNNDGRIDIQGSTGVFINSDTDISGDLDMDGDLTVDGGGTIALDLNVGGAVKGNAGTRAVSIGTAGSVIGGLQLWSTTSGTSYVQFGDESGTPSNHYRGYMSYTHANDSMALATAGATKVTLDSSGNVGIGDVPKTQHSNVTDSLNVGSHLTFQRTKDTYIASNFYYNSSDAGISIASGWSPLYLQDVVNGKHQWYNGTASATGADQSVSLQPLMTIDSSGNVLVGKTTSSIASEGVELFPNDRSAFTRDSGYPILVNRLTSDGDLINFRKDGTTVGSIGTYDGDIIIGTGTSRLRFYDVTPSILPSSSDAFGASDNAIDLGNDGRRFKDLYLGGDAYIDGDVEVDGITDTTRLIRSHDRNSSGNADPSERYPIGHHTLGEEVFSIDPTWSQDELRIFFNSNNVSWLADSDAPSGYAIKIDGTTPVGGEYGSGFPYIPVYDGDVFYMEYYIKTPNTNTGIARVYVGSNEYNQSFSSLGGNPGSYGYWVNSGTTFSPNTPWQKRSGYIKNTGGSNVVGEFESGIKYWTPMALWNYQTGSQDIYISGWRVIRVKQDGNRFFSGLVGIGTGTTTPSRQLHVNAGANTAARFETTADVTMELKSSNSFVGIEFDDSGGTNEKIWYNGSNGTFAIGGGGSNVTGKKLHIDGGVSIGSSADNLSVPSNGLYVEGNVGIGIHTPATKLHLTETSSAFQFTADTGTAGDGRLNIGHFSNGTFIGTYGDDGGAADVLRFGTHSGDERMRITSGGDVEIGTTTNAATRILTIDSSTVSKINLDVGSEGTVGNFEARSGEVSIGANTAADLHLKTSGTDQVTVDYIGNVGIGITSPENRLSIGSSQSGGIDFLYDSSNGYKNQIKNYWNSSTDTRMDFNIGRTVNVAPVTVMSVGYGGNVGIGTTSPVTKLDVVADSAQLRLRRVDGLDDDWRLYSWASGLNIFPQTTSTVFFGRDGATTDVNVYNGDFIVDTDTLFVDASTDRVGIGTTSPSDLLHLSGNTNSFNTAPIIRFDSTSTSNANVRNWAIGPADTEYGNFHIYKSTTRGGDPVGSAQSSTFTIDYNGNVGIGTTSPAYPLDILNNSTRFSFDTSTGVAILYMDGANGDLAGGDYSSLKSDGSGDFSITTGNTERLRVEHGGNVGIGTDNPSAKLHVLGVSQNTIAVDSAAYPEITFRVGGTIKSYDSIVTAATGYFNTSAVGDRIYRTEAGNHLFGYSSNELMRITTSGNVGIGTDSPDSILEIAGTTPTLTIDDTRAGSWISGDKLGTVSFRTSDGSAAGAREVGFIHIENEQAGTNTTMSGAMVFGSSAYNASATERMRIDSSGNVGIGTDSPVGSYTKTLHIHGSGTGASLHLTDLASGATASDGLEVFQYSTDCYIWEREAGNIRFGTNATERMRIHSNGDIGFRTVSQVENFHFDSSETRLGIGNATPDYTLDLNSGGSTTTARVSGVTNSASQAILRMTGYSVAGTQADIGAINFTNAADTGDAIVSSITAQKEGTLATAAGELQFKTKPYNSSLATRMTIQGDGNVGIGTTSPAYQLTLGGNSVGSTEGLRINDPSNANYGGHFSFSDSDNEVWIGGITNNVYNSAIGIYREATRTVTIDINNNVGIGTDSPGSKLHVYDNQNIAANGSGDGQLSIGGNGYTFGIALDGQAAHIYHNSSSRNIEIGTDEGTDLTIHTNGNISIADGNLVFAAGHGVDFSANQNNANMTSELLDDYEEGTFTPTIHAGASNISLASNNYGKYTKVGNVVHCSGRFQASSLTAGSSSTNVELGGLPFTCDAPLSTGTGAVAGSIGFAGGFAGEAATMMQIRDGETNAFLYYQNSSLTVSNVKGNDLGSTTTIVFQITYQTAS
jgi:hypothetical protein